MNTSRVPAVIAVSAIVIGLALLIWLPPTPPSVPCPSCPSPTAPAKHVSELRVYKTASCGYCRQLERTLADPAVKAALEGWTVKAVAVDREPVEGVTAVPTYDIYRDGQRVKRGSGYKTPAEFVAWLSTAQGVETEATFDLDFEDHGPLTTPVAK